ncbi:MAG: hypothetical protein KDE50_20245, partial [Caldilineaceae bacterium]|nr:hypothetical protein [Caldilineaceae bacterium]
MNRINRLAFYFTLALLAIGLTAAVVLAQDTVQTATPLEKAVNALGGAEALAGLETLATASTGVRWVLDEGYVPGGAPVRIGAYTDTVQIDVVNSSIHISQTRETLGQARNLIEVVAGDQGYMDGQDGRFGQPTQQAMGSDRLLSTIKQQMLLNPQLIVQALWNDPSQVSDAGEVLQDG